ncbi:hypothetical protein R1flu_020836 [Riccia fluitans]|uniref:Uncharacterized protein n=1 Tax=Riccia fluitans TaxID=41844 RepID=A0ABD1ZMM6_9MARC
MHLCWLLLSYAIAVCCVNLVWVISKEVRRLSINAAHAAGENPPKRKFLPVSLTDTIYFHPPASITSGSPNFSLPIPGRIPFMMQGVPQFNGGFLDTGTAGVSRLAAVRPFMNLNFGESANNSASGSRAQPVIQDFAESLVPSSQDPLPDGGFF